MSCRGQRGRTPLRRAGRVHQVEDGVGVVARLRDGRLREREIGQELGDRIDFLRPRHAGVGEDQHMGEPAADTGGEPAARRAARARSRRPCRADTPRVHVPEPGARVVVTYQAWTGCRTRITSSRRAA